MGSSGSMCDMAIVVQEGPDTRIYGEAAGAYGMYGPSWETIGISLYTILNTGDRPQYSILNTILGTDPVFNTGDRPRFIFGKKGKE
jgi:hypothetical protein